MDYSLSFILELLEAKGYKNVPKEDFHLFFFPLETQRVCWESQQNIRRCTKTYEMISVDDTAFLKQHQIYCHFVPVPFPKLEVNFSTNGSKPMYLSNPKNSQELFQGIPNETINIDSGINTKIHNNYCHKYTYANV